VREALLYQQLPKGRVRCLLCAQRCVVSEGHRGVCGVRENRGGRLFTLAYGRAISRNAEPVEKKPLYHFWPGSLAYSLATPGCNFRCQWCQNWEISQMPRQGYRDGGSEASPEQIVAAAQQAGCRSIAYTYTEPTVFFEYALDIARLAHKAGLANIFVTNGYMTSEMLDMFGPWLDAANVDLKAFREQTYRRYVCARLQPVLDSLRAMKQRRIWLEVTTLVIPGLNADPAELCDAATFIAQELGPDTPWHISRFFPGYRMLDRPPTPVKPLQQAVEIGRAAGLHHVYLGNLPGEAHTTCHLCGQTLIRRHGFYVVENRVENGRCPFCQALVAGVAMGRARNPPRVTPLAGPVNARSQMRQRHV
jgi:pyruvate formate lyase activating enzyme